MPAYLIANVEIEHVESMQDYMKSTPAIIKKYGGRFLARGGELWIAEGKWSPKRVVVVEFETFEKAKAFWHSDEYAPLKAMRQSAAKTDMIFVDGLSTEMANMLNAQMP